MKNTFKMRIGQFEISVRKVKRKMPDRSREVIDYACFLYDLPEDNLKTGSRYRDIPDTKKLISRTLYELGLTEKQISERYPWLGTRDTIHSQIAASRIHERSSGVFSQKQNLMAKKFGYKKQ